MFSILTRKALLLSLSLLLSGCVFLQSGGGEVQEKKSSSKKLSYGELKTEAQELKDKSEAIAKKNQPEDKKSSMPSRYNLGKEVSEQQENLQEEPDIIDELLKELEAYEEKENGESYTFPELIEDLLDISSVESVRPDIWPVMGLVTSKFGWRKRGRRTKKFHAGIDISAPYGSPVVATSAGKVIYAGWIRGYGNVVIIYHGYGFTTLYAHMSSLAVRNKDYVIKGQVIGYVGRSGRATGSHLHYEVLKYGVRQNPILFLP
jgi:murein DD-endopeptidase MepM/ murein hydrolase activator NlpD